MLLTVVTDLCEFGVRW